uniref:L1 transposable element RRM domain-containing protein n=1 Tax=Xenopus tropicalis TaxID=8364 RepID=A0A803K4A7_XENTR
LSRFKNTQRPRSEAATRLEQFARKNSQETAGSSTPSPSASPPLSDTSTKEPPTDNSSAPTSVDLMSAILQCQTSLTTTFTSKIEELKIDLSLIKQDIQTIRERTGALEERVGGVEDRTANLPQELTQIKTQLQTVTDRMDDLENRQRRSNVRVLGLPERSEGAHPETFAETWLKELLGQDAFSPQFVVERAHRVPLRPLPPGAPPRAFLIKLLNYRDRDSALREARKKGDLQYAGARISLYPDYSSTVQKKRSSYTGVKRKLRDLGLEYTMLYPAKLKIMDGGKAHFFDRPELVLEWLEHRPDNARGSPRAQR